MSINMERILYWSPRLLGILFAAFVSVFALDVFGEGYSFGDTIIALFMHLVPTAIIAVCLVIAWRWEWIGAILFVSLALLFLIMSGGESWIITLPLLVIGALFLLDWTYSTRLKTR